MAIERWCVTPVVNGVPAVDAYPNVRRGSFYPLINENYAICRLQFPDDDDEVSLDAVQADTSIFLFPSENTPASKLPTRVLNFLDNKGVVLEADDTVFNVVRKIRDLLIFKPAGRRFAFRLTQRV